jgi:AcrR family transcriptional regulator
VTKATATPAAAAPKTKHARLTPKQWAEAEALWESGEVTLDDLAARFGKHKSAFSAHFKNKGIEKGKRKEELKAAVKEEVARAAIDDATVLAARIKETKEEHYKMAAGLAKLSWNEILLAKQESRPVATALNNLKALDAAMTVLKKAREERWAVLGLDRDDALDEDGLPDLVISELTADQIEALRNRDDDDALMLPSEQAALEAELADLDDDEIIDDGGDDD